jgi:hypothetical protein
MTLALNLSVSVHKRYETETFGLYAYVASTSGSQRLCWRGAPTLPTFLATCTPSPKIPHTFWWSITLDSKCFCSRTVNINLYIYLWVFINKLYIHIHKHIVYITLVLGLRGLFSSRTPTEHQAHPTLGTTEVEYRVTKIYTECIMFSLCSYCSVEVKMCWKIS